MRKVSYLLLMAVVVLAACSGPAFKKASDKSGTEYKIITAKGGKLVTNGNTLEMSLLVKYKDSVLFPTDGNDMPQFAPYDTAQLPPLYKEIFRNVHVGDSIVIRIPTDSLIAKGQSAPFMQKGQYIMQSYKILNAYATEAEANKAREAAMKKAEAAAELKSKELVGKDDKAIADYLAKNKITATKTPAGAYVEILQPGTGPTIDTSMVPAVMYAGRVLGQTKVFDSNTQPDAARRDPLNVTLNGNTSAGLTTIKGWNEGLVLLNKGAKARFYIPSGLAYGPQPAGPDIPANSILVFDIEVANVYTQAEAVAAMTLQQNKMKEMQKRYMDSVQKANPQAQGQPEVQAPGN